MKTTIRKYAWTAGLGTVLALGAVTGRFVPARAGADATEFRSHAAECQQIADRWPDPIKRQYEELARQWLIVAEQADGHSGTALKG